MTFYEIEFPLATLSVESVEAALNEIGADSITFVDRGDEPVLEPRPNEIRLWSDTLVRELDRLAARLGAEFVAAARVKAVQDRDWERVWLTGWKSMRFGRRLWICPTGAETPD